MKVSNTENAFMFFRDKLRHTHTHHTTHTTTHGSRLVVSSSPVRKSNIQWRPVQLENRKLESRNARPPRYLMRKLVGMIIPRSQIKRSEIWMSNFSRTSRNRFFAFSSIQTEGSIEIDLHMVPLIDS